MGEGCESGVQASGLRDFTGIDHWVLERLRAEGSASRISEGYPNRGLHRIEGKGVKLVGLGLNCGQRALFAGVQVQLGASRTILAASGLTMGSGI